MILLLTANLMDVTRARSYPLRVLRRGAAEEKLPDTNGMFFGKRLTLTLHGHVMSLVT